MYGKLANKNTLPCSLIVFYPCKFVKSFQKDFYLSIILFDDRYINTYKIFVVRNGEKTELL
jgi:hypothetical protein